MKNTPQFDALAPAHDYSTLSIKDLIDARDHYHVHLMHKENVIATAIGLYLIRRDEPWLTESRHTSSAPGSKSAPGKPASGKPAPGKPAVAKPPRTLANSEVRPYSWPCVLVFVKQWFQPGAFGAGQHLDADDFVPPTLYMPDGRVVPVCIVQAEQDTSDPGPIARLSFPHTLVGGGYPLLVDVQGQEHVASVGCLVTDGHLVYALTNRHVAGAEGEKIYTVLNGDKMEIGVTSSRQLSRKLFQDVYPEWPGKDVYVDLDIGLIEVSDKSQWTAQIYGIGQMGRMADLSTANLSLRLIGCPVRAYGCASGQMLGSICALFYRYKSIGGFEYVSDFLIGPRRLSEGDASAPSASRPTKNGKAAPAPAAAKFSTHPGDSGTVWLLETGDSRGLMPLAVQWGGHVFFDNGNTARLRFALATGLSSVCNDLGVDVISDWNIGAPEYWGAVGHYTIAGKAIDLLADGKLSQWMKSNRDLITYPTDQVTDKNMKGLSKRSFVPLADVPDMVWKVGDHKRGGMSSPEHGNHFADMDQPRPGDGKTLLDLCKADADTNVSVAVWQRYYDAVGDKSRGLLPFRVWQIWNAMVEAAAAGDVDRFVCAAGIVAHYVGDSCQPLHISFRFNGDPDRMVPTRVKDPKTKQWQMEPRPAGTGCHSAYEDDMVNFHIDDINAGLAKNGSPSAPLPKIASGHDAAKAVVELMQRTFVAIQPLDIVNAYIDLQDQKASKRQVADALWKKFGDSTITVMRDGAQFLALIWQSAWDAGKGDRISRAAQALSNDDMIKLYDDVNFLPSRTLEQIASELDGNGTSAPSGGMRPNGKATASVRTRVAGRTAATDRTRMPGGDGRSARHSIAPAAHRR